MKHISVKLSDSDYEKVNSDRGERTISEYVRETLLTAHRDGEEEALAFHKLLIDVTTLKDTFEKTLHDLPDRKALLLLAQYFRQVMSVANPISYATEKDRLNKVFESLKADIANGREP